MAEPTGARGASDAAGTTGARSPATDRATDPAGLPVPVPARRFLVGGAVRDRLLGLPVSDRDYVVVGATAESLVAAGFTPVGRDFPVFLHPQTHEEHALARTERKTAPGYRGFVFHAAPDVTLEQDLARRDLTINAMAQADDGSVVDPFGGQADLQARILRHVAPAFAEDPVRILRVARFAARFTDFSIAPETVDLMREMVARGEVDALVPERVWQEFSRGLMEARPARMLAVLQDCGALARLQPALSAVWEADARQGAGLASCIDQAADTGASLPVRCAVLLQPLARADGAGKAPGECDTSAIADACARLKMPVDCRDLAVATGRESRSLQCRPADSAAAVTLLERCDALRKPERFDAVLTAVALLGGSSATSVNAIDSLHWWRLARDAARSVDAGAIAQQVRQAFPDAPMRINAAVREARIAAIDCLQGASPAT